MAGIVYLLHFDKPYYHAQHYLGYTRDLESRIERHKGGNGSPLVAAVVNAGIDIVVARTWSGDRNLERRLKNRHNTPRQLCPICRNGGDIIDGK